MGRYIVRRLLQMIPVVIGTTFLIFSAVWFLPGDPFAGKCGQRPCPSEYIAQQTDRLNLDDGVIVAYFKYMGNVLQGDFGFTFAGDDVAMLIREAFPVTLRLTILAVVIQLVFGVLLGVGSALRRNGVFDTVVLVGTLIVVALPVFVIGFLAQYFFGLKLGWFPVTVSQQATWRELVLPAFVLASLSLAFVARLQRTSMIESLRADYVRTAVAKGLPRRTVVVRHALRNSLIPVITFVGVDFGVLLAGAIVTEGIFNVPGIGGLTFYAIKSREGGLVVGVVVLVVLVFLLANLLVDLLYAKLDPRIRYE